MFLKKVKRRSKIVICIVLILAVAAGITIKNVKKEENNTVENENKTQSEQKEANEKEEGKQIAKDKETEAAKEENEAKAEVTQTSEIPSDAPAKEQNPIQSQELLPEDQLLAAYNNTLLIGDSRTEGFKIYSGVKNATYFSMKSLSVDKIMDGTKVKVNGSSYSIYEILDNGKYDKVIINLGINELGWTRIDKFTGYYGQLIDKVKEKQPDARIYVEAIIPIAKEKSDKDRVYNNAQVYWYNQNLIELAENKGAAFVNPAAALVDEDGYLLGEATTDGIHMNSQYCKIWANYLATLII